MKKLLIVCAMCATLFSCVKENSPKVNPLKQYEVQSQPIPAPAHADKGMLITVPSAPIPVLHNIELTESGDFLAYSDGEKTKAVDANANVVSGKYAIVDGYAVFTVAGYEVKIPYDVTFEAISYLFINNNSTPAMASGFARPADATVEGLCRTWYPVTYHASIMSGGSVIYNKKSDDVMTLQKDLFTYILDGEPTDEDLYFDAELESFIFTRNRTAAVCMSGDSYEVCEWTYENGRFRFFLNGNEVVATARFIPGTPNTMIIMLDLEATFEGNTGDYDLAVSGGLVVVMKDAK